FAGTLRLMQSDGGLCAPEVARAFPIRLLESGPAGGALATVLFARAAGLPDALAFDMGGTTAKACLIENGRAEVAPMMEAARVHRFKRGSGLPIRAPVVDMIEIGAGGGSIAWLDALGLLKVGPDSAGSDPGPACYGRGGDAPTVTDADLVLGYLDPGYFLGGRMMLDLDVARAAIERDVAGPLGIDVLQAAWGIHQVVNENMANAARIHAIERGKDPRAYPVFAFGGAGPVHAWRVSPILPSPRLIAPLGAGVTSTVGFLAAPLAFDFVRSYYGRLAALDWSHVNDLLDEMEQEGRRILGAAGVALDEITVARVAELRYAGQGHEIAVPLPDGLLADASVAGLQVAFEDVYRSLFERIPSGNPVEALSWRVTVAGPRPGLPLDRLASAIDAAPDPAAAIKGERPIYLPEEQALVPVPVYDRYRLAPGGAFSGPAVVEERESTVILGPGARVRVDELLSLVVEESGRA
ncbi:MAG TPA: hydantoinase/oxoprolinase family protein, partial [Thermomicrobiales bacterium]|nr:hydantoinase/oxoprolinase family protein [Thermomicrobiales bacterium]